MLDLEQKALPEAVSWPKAEIQTVMTRSIRHKELHMLGFGFNPQFTDEKAACMIVNHEAFVMLLTEPFLKTFTEHELCDTEGFWMEPKAVQ